MRRFNAAPCFFLILIVAFVLIFIGPAPASADSSLILATTTSTRDSGLLDEILPLFEKENHCLVKVVAVGTGAALRMGKDGDADVMLVHDPAAEEAAIREGFAVRRKYVMYNDFVLVGPKADPAGILGAGDILNALKKIADRKAVFVSRGDQSGTNMMELRLWKEVSIRPKGSWYLESGSGMAATLRVAAEKKAYCLTDRATWLSLEKELGLALLLSGDRRLFNQYHVMAVSPKVHPNVQFALAEKFIAFLLSPRIQKRIGAFGVKKFGEPLYHPAPPGKR
ncbi:MAG: substrate-binding domain-containing protein [bacterium]